MVKGSENRESGAVAAWSSGGYFAGGGVVRWFGGSVEFFRCQKKKKRLFCLYEYYTFYFNIKILFIFYARNYPGTLREADDERATTLGR